MGMGKEQEKEWDIESIPAYKSKTPEEIEWLWNATLPTNRDTHPAVWDSIIGFYEDAIVASCSRAGHLVVTPRELLKQLKHNGREPASAMKVIDELFQRGDIVGADSLKPPTTMKSGISSAMRGANTTTSSTFGSIRSTVSSYLWGKPKPSTPSLDDPIVPTSSLKAAAARAQSLEGPTASADIHTVKTFAQDVTCGNTKDAEAVISYMVSQGSANAIFTDVTKEQPDAVLGVKVGGKANESDKGVLRTKAALERMEEMVSHLEKAVAVEQNAAIECAKKGDKAAALVRVRKKKTLDAKLASTRSAASKLSDVLMAVDEAESNREAVSALETGMASLKVATQDGVTADRIDAVAAEFDDAMADQQDVRGAFETLNMDTAVVEADLEAELEDMLNDEKEVSDALATSLGDGTTAATAAAAAVAGSSRKDSKTAAVVDEAEAELARLLAELPMPQSPGKGSTVENASNENNEAATTSTEANVNEGRVPTSTGV